MSSAEQAGIPTEQGSIFQAGASTPSSDSGASAPSSKGKRESQSDPKRNSRTYGFFTKLSSSTYKTTIAENPNLGNGGTAYTQSAYRMRSTSLLRIIIQLIDDNITTTTTIQTQL
jgi:hypothetical protein